MLACGAGRDAAGGRGRPERTRWTWPCYADRLMRVQSNEVCRIIDTALLGDSKYRIRTKPRGTTSIIKNELGRCQGHGALSVLLPVILVAKGDLLIVNQ